MARTLLVALMAVLVAALQLSMSSPVDAAPFMATEATYKCKQVSTCTTPLPDRDNWECVEGLLPECDEWVDYDGCLKCSAGT